jgi:hypothetical protein
VVVQHGGAEEEDASNRLPLLIDVNQQLRGGPRTRRGAAVAQVDTAARSRTSDWRCGAAGRMSPLGREGSSYLDNPPCATAL